MTTRSLSARHAARTDVGRARDHNEDRVLVRPPLYVVADGLGGHSAGEVAAQMLVDRLARLDVRRHRCRSRCGDRGRGRRDPRGRERRIRAVAG